MAGLTGLLVNGVEGEMEPLVVSSRYRSRGIGRALVTYVVEQARRMGIRCVTVRPVARNKQAIAFLVRQGVDLLGELELFRDLSDAPRSRWKVGISIHGQTLGY